MSKEYGDAVAETVERVSEDVSGEVTHLTAVGVKSIDFSLPARFTKATAGWTL